MSGQLAPIGQQAAINRASGTASVVVSSTAPTWVPGRLWVDTTSGAVLKKWNGSSWVADDGLRYLALLFADPTDAINISDLKEITTGGYARQSVTFSAATEEDPTSVNNNAVVSFGPFTEDMSEAAGWLALVDVASGNSGQLLYVWEVALAQQVSASQSIQIAIGKLTMNLS